MFTLGLFQLEQHILTCDAAAAAMSTNVKYSLHLLLVFLHCWISILYLQVPAAEAANSFQSYAIDWDSVPAVPDAANNLSTSCICALLNGTCTTNCCCDPACPSEAVDAFRAGGNCLPEGPPPSQLAYCLPDEPFAKVNLPSGDYYRMQKPTAESDFLTQMLCIRADHNPSLGLNYPDPAAGDVGTNAQEATCSQAATDTMLELASKSSTAATNSYNFGQVVVVSAVAAGGGRTRGSLTLPVAAVSAECLQVQQVGFMERLPASLKAQAASCQRTISSAAALSAMCNDTTSLMSPTFYSGLQFPPTPSATTLKSINLTSLSRRNPVTGDLVPLNPATDWVAPIALAGPQAGCVGVVVEAHFLLRYSTDAETGGNQLSSAGVSLVVDDIAAPAGGGPLAIQTAYSVNWANVSVPDTALQPFSGAPGYLLGFPLLAGTVESAPSAGTTKQAVSRFTNGLQLPGAGPDGICSGSSSDAVAVGFGYNSTSSCSVAYTLAQLRAFCTAGNGSATLTNIMGRWLTEVITNQMVLGVWGNSDSTNINQWVTVKADNWPPAKALSWDEAAATCNNVLTGFSMNVLTGVAFAAGNLQSKVLYGQVCFQQGSWRFNRLPGYGSAVSTQAFPLQFTVSYIPKQQSQPQVSMKPNPPLFRPLPSDLFYPFMTSAAEVAVMWHVLVLVLAAVIPACL